MIKIPERWNIQKIAIDEVVKKLTKWIDIFEYDYQVVESGQLEQMEKLVSYYKSLLLEVDKGTYQDNDYLVEVLKTTAYSYTVNYGRFSCNISAYNPDTCTLFKTQEEAYTYGLKEVERLQVEAGSVVTSLEIERFCVECDGRGFNVVKSGKRVIRRKEVKCQVCDGKGTELVSKEEF